MDKDWPNRHCKCGNEHCGTCNYYKREESRLNSGNRLRHDQPHSPVIPAQPAGSALHSIIDELIHLCGCLVENSADEECGEELDRITAEYKTLRVHI